MTRNAPENIFSKNNFKYCCFMNSFFQKRVINSPKITQNALNNFNFIQVNKIILCLARFF